MGMVPKAYHWIKQEQPERICLVLLVSLPQLLEPPLLPWPSESLLPLTLLALSTITLPPIKDPTIVCKVINCTLDIPVSIRNLP
jgi:hypothetical protein